MKKNLAAARRSETAKKGREKCPCCDGIPCRCERTCLCQELKSEAIESEALETADDDESFGDDLRFSYLRHGGLFV